MAEATKRNVFSPILPEDVTSHIMRSGGWNLRYCSADLYRIAIACLGGVAKAFINNNVAFSSLELLVTKRAQADLGEERQYSIYVQMIKLHPAWATWHAKQDPLARLEFISENEKKLFPFIYNEAVEQGWEPLWGGVCVGDYNCKIILQNFVCAACECNELEAVELVAQKIKCSVEGSTQRHQLNPPQINRQDFLKKVMDVSLGDESSRPLETPMEHAASHGNLDFVKLLVDYGAEITYQPLANAAQNNHLEVVKYLIHKKPQLLFKGTGLKRAPWISDPGGHLLVDACRNGKDNPQMLNYLLDLTKRDVQILLQNVLPDTHKDCEAASKEQQPRSNSGDNNPFFDVNLRMSHLNSCDLDSHTPIMCAAASGKAKVVEILLAHGANPSLQSSYDFIFSETCRPFHSTALHMAVHECHIEVIDVLLKCENIDYLATIPNDLGLIPLELLLDSSPIISTDTGTCFIRHPSPPCIKNRFEIINRLLPKSVKVLSPKNRERILCLAVEKRTHLYGKLKSCKGMWNNIDGMSLFLTAINVKNREALEDVLEYIGTKKWPTLL